MPFLSNAPNNPKTKDASNSQEQPEVFATSSIHALTGERKFVLEPMTKEWCDSYNSQVLIPVRYSGQMYAMSGPLSACIENPKQNITFFPTHPRLKPIGC